MFFLLVPRFEGSIVEGFARAVVSLFAPPLLATKTPALNSCIPNTCNLIENERLYPLHSQHLQKTGGRGHKPVPRSDHARKPIPSTQLQFPQPQLLSFDKSPRTKGYTHPHRSNQSLRALRSTLFPSSAHGPQPTGQILFPRSPLVTRHFPSIPILTRPASYLPPFTPPTR